MVGIGLRLSWCDSYLEMKSVSANVKTAFVTGASGDIGRSIVETLTEEGIFVVGQFNGRAPSVGRVGRFIQCDFSSSSNIQSMASMLVQQYDIDILVNCAGGLSAVKPFEKLEISELRNAMDVNFYSAVLLIQKLIPLMRSRGFGRIVNIGSNGISYFGEDVFSYSIAKHSLEYLTRFISRHYCDSHITCNLIHPGLIQSSMHEAVEGYDEERYEARKNLVPLGRAGMPWEIASVVRFLVSDEASFVTGQCIAVAGGE